MAKRAKRAVTQEQIDEIEAERVMHGYAPANPPSVPQDPTPEDVKAYEEQQAEEEDMELDGEAIVAELEDVEEGEKVPNSIVKDKFKVKYIENARAIGAMSKAAKRSNWDWLSQQLAAACLSEKGKIEIGAFTDILDANGVDHSKWTNRNKGWEGRFRMTGRVALQKVVANSGKLVTPGGTELEAPAEWCERYKTKA